MGKMIIALIVLAVLCVILSYVAVKSFISMRKICRMFDEQKEAFRLMEEANAKAAEKKDSYKTGDFDADIDTSVSVVSDLSKRRKRNTK